MDKSPQNSDAKPAPTLWAGQVRHLSGLLILLALVSLAWIKLGRPHAIAFWVAVAVPVLHQIFVWWAWRTELNSAHVSKTIGFQLYLLLFFTLFAGRFLSLLCLAWLDRESLGLPASIQVPIACLLAVPGFYAMYSVHRYFGLARAAGADHFDKRYRDMPLINEGIFRFTSNGMYVYAFLLCWLIAIGFDSSAALTVAAFSHLYIWLHYFATEKPDLNFLYGASQS